MNSAQQYPSPVWQWQAADRRTTGNLTCNLTGRRCPTNNLVMNKALKSRDVDSCLFMTLVPSTIGRTNLLRLSLVISRYSVTLRCVDIVARLNFQHGKGRVKYIFLYSSDTDIGLSPLPCIIFNGCFGVIRQMDKWNIALCFHNSLVTLFHQKW